MGTGQSKPEEPAVLAQAEAAHKSGKLEKWVVKKGFMMCARIIFGAATAGSSENIMLRMLPVDAADYAFDTTDVIDCRSRCCHCRYV